MYDIAGKRAGVLVHISDDREGRALGVKRQEEDTRHLASRLQLTLSDAHVYVENDISASRITAGQRDGFEAFMADWQSGKFDVPLAYTTSRLTRDNIVAERIIETARQAGISPYFVASPWCDLNTAAGRRMYRSLAVSDTAEAEDIQERILRKKLEDAREGRTGGGRRRYGYGKILGSHPITGKEYFDPYETRTEEVANLREGMQRMLAGDSQFNIMRDWKQRGIKTAYGHDWCVGKLKQTLLNESYVEFDPSRHPSDCPCLDNPTSGGTRLHHDERHRAKWPAVFTRAEHDAMTAVFSKRQAKWSNVGRLKGRTYLLSGLVFCGGIWPDTERVGQVCGGYMYGQSKCDGGISKRRYACKKWDGSGDRVGCGTVFRIADAVEHLVTEQVLYRFDSPEVAHALTPTDNEERMAVVIQRLAELTTRREQLATEYAAGEHEKEDYRVMLTKIKECLTEAEAEKKQLLSAKAKSLAVPTDGGLREVWQTASLEWRASVIKLLVEKIVIHPGRPGGKMWPDKNGWRFNPGLVEIVWLH